MRHAFSILWSVGLVLGFAGSAPAKPKLELTDPGLALQELRPLDRRDPAEAPVRRCTLQRVGALAGGERGELADEVGGAGEQCESEEEKHSGYPLKETIFLSKSDPISIITRASMISLWPADVWYSGAM